MKRTEGLPAPRTEKEFGDSTPDLEVSVSAPTHVIVPLLSLDPRKWIENKRKGLWEYMLEGGLRFVCPLDQDAPDNGILMHARDVLCAIFWLENVDKQVVKDYWNMVGRVEGILNTFSAANTQSTEQFSRLYSKIMGIELKKVSDAEKMKK